MTRDPKRTGFHVTRNREAVLSDGIVKPMRMPRVYLLASEEDAQEYRKVFGGEAIVEVEFTTADIFGRTYPKYAPHGVIRLRDGKTATVIREIERKRK
jgi:hypothetical protein